MVIASGAIVGCVAGLLGPIVFIAACVGNDRTTWSVLTDPEAIPSVATLAFLGIVNGAVGAWDGWRSSARSGWPVAWAPLLLFLYPAAEFAQYPSDSKLWGTYLFAVTMVAPFLWVAGRVGQEIGVAGRKRLG